MYAGYNVEPLHAMISAKIGYAINFLLSINLKTWEKHTGICQLDRR